MSKLLSQFIPPSPSPAVSICPFSMSVSPWNHMLLVMEDTFGLLWSSIISHPKEKHFPHTLRQARWSLSLCLNTSGCGATGVFLSVPFTDMSNCCLALLCNQRASTFLLCLLTAASRATRTKPGALCVPGQLPSLPASKPPLQPHLPMNPFTDLTAKLALP